MRALAAGVLIALGSLIAATPASARILKTKRLASQARELALVIGSAIEYETDSEESDYGFPLLLEYGFSDALKLTVEPAFVLIRSKVEGSTSGFSDLETSLNYEFISERRSRPAVAAEGLIKWPTASPAELGTGKADYSLGVILSKEFVRFDLDFNARYTFVGSPPGIQLKNTTEVSLAADWHLNDVLDLEAEVVTGSGALRGQAGALGGLGSIGASQLGGSETEMTLGLAEQLSERLKLEQGGAIKSDGSWQAIIAWEWDFAGGE
jgi:hypothetical protein